MEMIEFVRAAHGKRGPEWVKKLDIVRYDRCPYAFWLLDTKQVTLPAVISAMGARRIADGIRFEDAIVDAAEPAPEKPITELFQERMHLLRVPLIENRALQIYGRPDGVDTAEGMVAPIEVKHHREVSASDRLELAFYWLLLEPYRTRNTDAPYGFVYVRRDNESHEPMRVDLHEGDFQRVRDLVELVRVARRNGVQPRQCACEVCATRREIADVRSRADSPSLLLGVGWKRARALEQIGIATLDDLLSTDAEAVVAQLKPHKHFVSPAIVQGWKHHARALKSGKPVWFGAERPMLERYLVLDLEYNPGGAIWLTGVHIENGEDVQTLQFWSDDDGELRAALDTLKDIVFDYPELPIVTWGGDSADLPALMEATRRHRLRSLPSVLEARHFDMCAFTTRNVRLPISSHGLKDVAAYYGYPATTSVSGGMEAAFLYDEYLYSRSKKKRAQLREQLEAYNRDDLLATRHCIEHLHALAARGVLNS